MSEDKKKQYWGEERNATRRRLYNTDPARAEKLREARRKTYRSKSGRVDPPSCASNVGRIPAMASQVAVRLADADTPLVIANVYRQSDVAELLNRKPPIIYRWVQNGQLPPPALVDDLGNRYYAEAEVRAFVNILGELQSKTRHYRADHTEVRDRLFAASFDTNRAMASQWLAERTGK